MSLSLDAARTLLVPPSPAPIVYTIKDVESCFGVPFSSEQKAALDAIPFSEEALRACAGTHMLLPSPPLSLLEIRDKHPDLFYRKTKGWYARAEEEFSRTPQPVRWHLLRTGPVPDSFSKTWDEQCSMLKKGEEVPTAALVALAAVLHFKKSGHRLFEKCYVRCSDQDSDGLRVCVGDFDDAGLFVGSGRDDYRYSLLGLASSRNVP